MALHVRDLMVWRYSHKHRVKGALYASVVGVGATFLFWASRPPSTFPGAPGIVMDTMVFAVGTGFFVASLFVLGALWVPWLRRLDPPAWLAILGFVMVMFLMSSALSRPDSYQDTVAGIIASLMVALVVQEALHNRPSDARIQDEEE